MKRILLLLTAATALLFAFACNGSNDDPKEKEYVLNLSPRLFTHDSIPLSATYPYHYWGGGRATLYKGYLKDYPRTMYDYSSSGIYEKGTNNKVVGYSYHFSFDSGNTRRDDIKEGHYIICTSISDDSESQSKYYYGITEIDLHDNHNDYFYLNCYRGKN